MKKMLMLLSCLYGIVGHSQVLETGCIPPGGTNLLSYAEVRQFSSNYSKFHSSSLENHTKALYVDDVAILFLDLFFNNIHIANRDYHGFNVYFITYTSSGNPHQRKNSQTFLYLVPVYDSTNTRGRVDTVPDYKALLSFYNAGHNTGEFSEKRRLNSAITCYGTCDSSVINWEREYPPALPAPYAPYRRLNMSDVTRWGQTERFLLTVNVNSHRPERDNYLHGQGSELNEYQTKWAYFKKETIFRLAAFIRNSTNRTNFPLMGIYFGSYNTIFTNQRDEKQTMLCFTPMKRMDTGNLEPDICSYIGFWKQKKQDQDPLFIAENHGELCPDDCPPEGFH